MINVVSSDQRWWRYLSEPGDGNGSFTRFLREIGVSLSGHTSLQEMVRLGWIEPRLRVELPSRFYAGWTNHPLRNRTGTVDPADSWAAMTLDMDNDFIPAHLDTPPMLPPRWWEHPLDDSTHPDITPVWAHASTPAQLRHPPEPITHPNGIRIQPWHDFFSYWQGYHLLDLLGAIKLFPPIENTPAARELLTETLSKLDDCQRFSDASIERAAKRWAALATAFDWLSRYRTLLGWWVHHGAAHEDLIASVQQLATEQKLTPDRLRADIQDHLLVLWSNLGFFHKDWPTSARELLREDIHRAFEFLALLTGEAIDQDDPFWNPPDPNPREWSRPHEVLPFETITARRALPRTSQHYLAAANELLLGDALTQKRVEQLLDLWWDQVPALRRFSLNVARLHRDYSADPGRHRLMLDEPTPIDYLLLTTGATERVFLYMYLRAQGGKAAAPRFNWLCLWASDVLTKYLGLAPIRPTLKPVLKQTRLHDLTEAEQPSNPFSSSKPQLLPKKSLPDLLVAAFHDFAVMRNYAGHHDVLDDELLVQGWGGEPLKAILFLTLLGLAASSKDANSKGSDGAGRNPKAPRLTSKHLRM